MTPTDTSDLRGLRGLIRRTRTDPGLRREADMMGFYVSIALLAALTTGNDHQAHSQLDVLGVVWGTTIGLALAHWFAIVVSARLVRDPDLHHTPMEVLASQMGMGVAIAIASTTAVLILPEDLERLGARVTAALFIAVIVQVESIAGGSTLRRAVSLGVLALVVALTIATFKWFIGK